MQMNNQNDGASSASPLVKPSQEQQRLLNLIEIAQVLSQQNELAEIIRLVTQKAITLLEAEMALLLLVNPRTRQTVKTIFKAGVQVSQPRYHALQTQISGWILFNCQPLLCSDLKQDARFSKIAVHDLAITSVLGVPLKVEGVVIGTLLLFNKKNGKVFSESDLEYFDKLAMIAAPYLRNVQQVQQYFIEPLPESALLAKYQKLGFLGKGKKFVAMLQAVEAAARSDVRVLLEGGSGTGKELVARAIHQLSGRCQGPFMAIDCGAIPANLLESELFGHARGAFTGATFARTGLIQEADHGTLFMDEIANLPVEMQAKLLRVLQDSQVRPVGSNKSCQVDVRIIAASSDSLHKRVEQQQFREDLFYRLYVYPIAVPSLGERREDIPLLAHYFLKKFAMQQNKPVESFHSEILEFMKCRAWPGNIRELENFVQRVLTLAPLETSVITREVLPPDLAKEFKKLKPVDNDQAATKSLGDSLTELEKQLILKALVDFNWNQSRAARSLKISVTTLRYKMEKLKIKAPQ